MFVSVKYLDLWSLLSQSYFFLFISLKLETFESIFVKPVMLMEKIIESVTKMKENWVKRNKIWLFKSCKRNV